MKQAIYIATTDRRSGKSLASLGIIHNMMLKNRNIGYFRPIIDGDLPRDNHIDTVLSYFKLNMKYNEAYAFTRREVIDLKNKGKSNEIFDLIIKKYKALETRFDFVLVEGTDFFNEGSSFDFELTKEIAKNLSIDTILVTNGSSGSQDDITKNALLEYEAFKRHDIHVLAIIINKFIGDKETLTYQINKKHKDVLVSVVPAHPSLLRPSLKELTEALNATLFFGKEKKHHLTNEVIVGAMQMHNYLEYISENCVVVTPGDRADLLVATMMANMSANHPKIACIILTGGLKPEESVIKLIRGISLPVPVMTVKIGTFETVSRINQIRTRIYPENTTKIKLSIELFKKHVDTIALENLIKNIKQKGVTPRMFQYNLFETAYDEQKHIVLPEGNDDRILQAASRLVEDKLVRITLLGETSSIQKAFKRLDLPWNSKRISVVNPIDSTHLESYAKTLYKIRKHKGMELEKARNLMLDVSYFGTMMVHQGHADGMVSGAAHTTQHTMRPALEFIKTKPNVKTVSSVFFMLLPDRVLIYGDCAIVPSPTAEQLAEITLSSAATAESFGITPKIALLSYSSGDSGKGHEVEKVKKATELARKERPDLLIEGPIQYDAAVDPMVGGKKLPNSPVAGQANVLIFPDLNTGNNTYKAVQQETGALAIGPVIQGLNKPVNDLSRGATVEDIYNTVIITAIQSSRLQDNKPDL